MDAATVALWPSAGHVIVNNLAKYLLDTLIILMFMWMAYACIRFVINRKITNPEQCHAWRDRVFYFFVVISAFLIGRVWISGLQQMFTLVSILAAAYTVTQKETLMNVTGCFVIRWRKLFKAGDRIEIDGNYGEVARIGMLYFEMMECRHDMMGDQTTGRLMKVPNGEVLDKPLINYSEPFASPWQQIKMMLTDTSNVKQAITFLEKHLNKAIADHYPAAKAKYDEYMKTHLVADQQFETQHYVYVDPANSYGITLVMRFMCPAKHVSKVESDVWEAFLAYIDKRDDIKLALTSYRIHVDQVGGHVLKQAD
jgi:small-conductance mechanosensitive channel